MEIKKLNYKKEPDPQRRLEKVSFLKTRKDTVVMKMLVPFLL